MWMYSNVRLPRGIFDKTYVGNIDAKLRDYFNFFLSISVHNLVANLGDYYKYLFIMAWVGNFDEDLGITLADFI
jgi:hypothetical protein